MAEKKKQKKFKISDIGIETIERYYCESLPKFKFKKIPKELVPTENNKLVYYLDHVHGTPEVGILKRIIPAKSLYEVYELHSKFPRTESFEFDGVMLVPENTIDYKKNLKYLK